MNDKQALIGYTGKISKMADESIRLCIDFKEQDFVDVARLFGKSGTSVAVAVIVEAKTIAEHIADAHSKRDFLRRDMVTGSGYKKHAYSEQAKLLWQSGFFRSPAVWEAVGTDTQFLEWLKHQKCCSENSKAYCSGDIVAAHVRRVANGAGVGIKPKFSAVPLCHLHHNMQHVEGESSLGGKEWFDQQRIKHISIWAKDALKIKLGYSSTADIPPSVLIEWADQNGLSQYIPNNYKE
jgi:hypothetical protein